MNSAEQSRTSTKACQLKLVEAKIAAAVAKGKFECEGDGHLEDVTMDSVRKHGYRIRNGSFGFKEFWHASWKEQS